MDATQYEQRVRETAAAMGYDARTIDRMFSPEVNATIAANDARADATERHQEARRLALAHIAQEQAEADPGAAQRYEAGFAEFARGMGVDAATLDRMQELPSGGMVSEARVRDLTARYAEALRVREAGGQPAGAAVPPFEPTGEFVAPRLEDDKFYKYMLDNARFADARTGGNRSETDVRRLWEAKVNLMRLEHNEQRVREQRAQAAADATATEERVQEAVPLQVTDTAEEEAWEVVLAQAGDTKTGGRRYTPQALQDAVQARRFDGAKLYMNHEDAKDRGRGHRDVQLWAGTIRPGSVRFDPMTGSVIGTAALHHPAAHAIMRSPTARASVGLSMDSTITTRKAADGRQEVTGIRQVHSVDLVPEGNAVHGRSVIGPAA